MSDKEHPIFSDQSVEVLSHLRQDEKFTKILQELENFCDETKPTWHPTKPMSEPEHAFFCGNAEGMHVILNLLSGK